MRKKKEIYVFAFLLFVILISSMVSADFFDWLKKTITGKASSQPTDVSLPIVGVNPVVITVWNETLTGSTRIPTENGQALITINVTVMDPDGVSDINDSSVTIRMIKSGVTRENNTACSQLSESNATSQNYTCQVDIWYFDAPGVWNINVTANDLGNTSYISENSKNFTYDQLQAIVIFPDSISWATVVPGNTNQTASNSTTINNTGNYNASGNLAVKAINLYSEANYIDVGNFSVDIETGGSPPAECDGVTLVNATNATILVSVLERGNLSAAGANANETIYYCLRDVPITIPSGTYDTSTSGSWSINLQ